MVVTAPLYPQLTPFLQVAASCIIQFTAVSLLRLQFNNNRVKGLRVNVVKFGPIKFRGKFSDWKMENIGDRYVGKYES